MASDNLALTHVHYEVDGDGIATVLLDVRGERMNTLSEKLAADLETAIRRVTDDAGVRAVVLGSKKKDFLAGADIEMLRALTSRDEATRASREAQEGFGRIAALHEELGKPVVCAIHGAALGGGLELALACSHRIVSDSPKTTLGLPEVQLGLLPGAGGTQRLPKLIGIANALDLILTGKKVRPKKALRLGLADEVVSEHILLQVARARALAAARGDHPEPKRGVARLRELATPEKLQEFALEDNPVGQRILFKKALDALRQKTRGNYPAPERALRAVRAGVLEGSAAGFAAEADGFGELVMSPEARALISIFFATQDLKKDNGTDDPTVKARPITKIGVLGGGLMGAGITTVNLIEAGLPTRIKEVDDAALARGFKHVARALAEAVKKGRLSRGQGDTLLHMATGSTTMTGFHSAEVVIEAVFEDLEIKRKVLRDVEANGRPDVVFASNTSSLPITQIAEASKHPETVIGMHYFSPVEKMPLLEIIVTDKTAPWVTATCVQLGKDQGKTVIVVRDGTGFYTTRILGPYLNEAAWLISEGAAIEAIDEAMVDFGFPVGPIVLLDEVGIDVGAKVAKVLQHAFGERLLAPGAMETLIADDRKGRKNGRGFYRYEEGKKTGVDGSVYKVFGQSDKRKSFDTKLIQERLSLSLVNEALRCLEEGILRSGRDGDIGAIFGLGFPPFLGGPFSYVDDLSAGEVLGRLERLHREHGKRFEPAGILRTYAKSGEKFRH
jgi:3-hydroxyacyl-CoA dehydrogenase / enoyl-CoA hydratase / 3-hydroxybutyryl-CoA epimerase